jgi:CO/xanthine dehydrogenase Mo-binding subunit
MTYELLGKDFTPPDLKAKVTGRAKYAEDFRVDGMAFCKLLASPIAARASDEHRRERRARDARRVRRAHGRRRADLPAPQDDDPHERAVFVGQPILAVAAETEELAADALEKIKVDLRGAAVHGRSAREPVSGRPEARTTATSRTRTSTKSYKWTARDFAGATDGSCRRARRSRSGRSATSTQGYRARSSCSTSRSSRRAVASLARAAQRARVLAERQVHRARARRRARASRARHRALLGIEPEDLAFIAEFCGGGFGSKGGAYPMSRFRRSCAKKISRPVMMRISRHEEYSWARRAPGSKAAIKIGFRGGRPRDGGRPLHRAGERAEHRLHDWLSAADAVSLVYQPPRCASAACRACTNTPPRGPQRGPVRTRSRPRSSR